MESEDRIRQDLEHLFSERDRITREINLGVNGIDRDYPVQLKRVEQEIQNYAAQANSHGFGYMDAVKRGLP